MLGYINRDVMDEFLKHLMFKVTKCSLTKVSNGYHLKNVQYPIHYLSSGTIYGAKQDFSVSVFVDVCMIFA